MPYGGIFCIGEGIVTHNLLPHQCRYICLHSAPCEAYNYNVTDGKCTRLTSPCPQAFSDPVMEFVVFRETPVNHCYEWVPYTSGDPLDERMIATDTPWLIVARLQVNDNGVVGYMTTRNRNCYGTFGETGYNSNLHRCERLRVMEGCTIFWVAYIAGDTLPSTVVIGGVLANGDVAYVVKFDIFYRGSKNISGYYIESDPHAISGYAGKRRSTAVMMMVVL